MKAEDEQQITWNYLELELHTFAHYAISVMVAY